MTEITPLLREWHNTLIHLACVFSPVSELAGNSALNRAQGIAKLSREYRESLHTPVLRTSGLALTPSARRPRLGAVERAEGALKRLSALREAAGTVERPADANFADFYTFEKSLRLRRRKLSDLQADLLRVNVARYEMMGTVPRGYSGHILNVARNDLRVVSQEQAAGIILLHRTGVDPEYVASVINPADLNEETARHVLKMFMQRVPAEYASSMV